MKESSMDLFKCVVKSRHLNIGKQSIREWGYSFLIHEKLWKRGTKNRWKEHAGSPLHTITSKNSGQLSLIFVSAPFRPVDTTCINYFVQSVHICVRKAFLQSHVVDKTIFGIRRTRYLGHKPFLPWSGSSIDIFSIKKFLVGGFLLNKLSSKHSWQIAEKAVKQTRVT